MSGRAFVNYRRDDEPAFAGRIYDRLEAELGADRLFMDVEGHIKGGDDFVDVLKGQVAQCDLLLAIIGPRWLEVADKAGRRRLDDPQDWVRVEIVGAFQTSKRVIPVLVGGATMPRAEDLPVDLSPLARRQAIRITQERFKADVQGLVSHVRLVLEEAERDRRARSKAERAEAERVQAELKLGLAEAAAVARASEPDVTLRRRAGRRPKPHLQQESQTVWPARISTLIERLSAGDVRGDSPPIHAVTQGDALHINSIRVARFAALALFALVLFDEIYYAYRGVIFDDYRFYLFHAANVLSPLAATWAGGKLARDKWSGLLLGSGLVIALAVYAVGLIAQITEPGLFGSGTGVLSSNTTFLLLLLRELALAPWLALLVLAVWLVGLRSRR